MIWLTPEWEKKSNANRSNRAVVPDSMLHTGGSISFAEHKRRMIFIIGGKVEASHFLSYRDVYDHVHKNKDGEYVSQHSKNFIESYDTVMLEKYGEDSSMHPLVDYEFVVQEVYLIVHPFILNYTTVNDTTIVFWNTTELKIKLLW
ncbi:hypothetical protein CR513_01449, partial [Mucuna pruriens]